jgi:hypothetical protein
MLINDFKFHKTSLPIINLAGLIFRTKITCFPSFLFQFASAPTRNLAELIFRTKIQDV